MKAFLRWVVRLLNIRKRGMGDMSLKENEARVAALTIAKDALTSEVLRVGPLTLGEIETVFSLIAKDGKKNGS